MKIVGGLYKLDFRHLDSNTFGGIRKPISSRQGQVSCPTVKCHINCKYHYSFSIADILLCTFQQN